MSLFTRLIGVSVFLICSIYLPVLAAYPEKPVRITVGFSAGGSADIIARELGAKLTEQSGQPYIVENKSGATGTIAAAAVAHYPADGYSMLLISQSTMVVAPVIYPKLGFDTLRDFIPVSLLVTMPMVLVVNPAVPANNLQELITYAKASQKMGKEIAFASAGPGGPQHIAGELLSNMGKFKWIHIPYKGESQALDDVLGGQVPAMFVQLPTVTPFLKTGQLRPLAISTAARHPKLRDLPTVAEAGNLPGYMVQTWYGIFVPTGTPPEIVKKIKDQTYTALKSPDLIKTLSDQGVTPVGALEPDFAGFIKDEIPKWTKLIKTFNIQTQ